MHVNVTILPYALWVTSTEAVNMCAKHENAWSESLEALYKVHG